MVRSVVRLRTDYRSREFLRVNVSRLRHVRGGALLAIATVVLAAHPCTASAQVSAARAAELFARGVSLEARGHHTEALALFWEAAALAPGDADIQNGLGQSLARLGALDPAVEAFSRALSVRPAFRKAANNLILTLVKAGRGPEALRRAETLVASAPGDAHALFTLGLAQAEQDVAAALESFRRALRIDPSHTLSRYNLALVLKRADRAPEAVDHLMRIIRTEPRAEAHYTLGVIYWQQGELDRAAASLRAAVSADPGSADAHDTLGAVLKDQGDWAGAVDALRRAIALRPDGAGAHYTLGRVLQLAGEDAAARAHLADAERLRQRAQREQEASVWTSVGTQRLDSGDPVTALDHFRRATSLFDEHAPAHYQAGRALQRLGDHDASRAAFARAQQLNPSLVPPGEP